MKLPTQDTCFRNWLASQSDNDLRRTLNEDVGDMIRDRVHDEIEHRGIAADILPFTNPRAFATMCRPVFVSAFFASQLLALLRSSE